MWTDTLIKTLRREATRWRWTAIWSHHGGDLHGTSQKRELHIEIEYARSMWAYTVKERIRKEWVITTDGHCRSVEDLTAIILSAAA